MFPDCEDRPVLEWKAKIMLIRFFRPLKLSIPLKSKSINTSDKNGMSAMDITIHRTIDTCNSDLGNSAVVIVKWQ